MIKKYRGFPPGKISADARELSCLLAFVFSLLSCFHSLRIVCFFPFSWFRLQNQLNQPASCSYFIKITCNNKCYAQIAMGVADYSKRQLKTVRFPHLKSTDLNRIQVITLACCNIQDKQRYYTMLAAATGKCAVTNVTYNETKYRVFHYCWNKAIGHTSRILNDTTMMITFIERWKHKIL